MKKILISLFLIIPGVVCAGPHTVQKGETWEDIAKLYDINLTKLKLANDYDILMVLRPIVYF